MKRSSPNLSVTVHLNGELDLLTAPSVLDELLTYAAVAHAHEIVVDLCDVTFMDCAGLKPLIAAKNMLNQRGRQLRLRHVPPNVARLIRAAGLAELLASLDVTLVDLDVALVGDCPEPAGYVPVQEQRLAEGYTSTKDRAEVFGL